MRVKLLKDKRNQPIGCVVVLSGGQMGWSLCNKKDFFVESLGIEIAAGRALCGTRMDTPNKLERLYRKMTGKL
ncbi:MAG TPA: hypothetical protein ENH65_10005 [Candidatus Aminicenantes bacterium]|nr:hypothetical protein [Candidatus Aminicenantes bacterium]